MVYKFSDASKRALESAEKFAIELGHNFIGTEHILYGIAIEENGLGRSIYGTAKSAEVQARTAEAFGRGTRQ